MKFVTIIAFSLVSIASFGQVNITPYISAGWANHLNRNGLNMELGIESEFFR
jgi:hypothetical protein